MSKDVIFLTWFLHVQLHDWTHFHGAFNLEDGAALGELYSLIQVAGFDQRVPTYNLFDLRERPVGDNLLTSFDDFARSFKRLAPVLDMTFFSKVLEPGHPFLHHLLRSLRRSPALTTAIKIYKLAHSPSSFDDFTSRT